MRDEYDFSKGKRGKFSKPDAEMHLPVYLDADVQSALAAIADAKGVELSAFVNSLLKKDIELLQKGR
ncbi:MAG TPA: hypothetical protein VMH83_14075 [Candidatus Acidoferrum sp.]|nr:hypothetical protein [Candidatus Acidoferrum sp.]